MSEYSDIFNLHFRYELVINLYRILQNSVAKLTMSFFFKLVVLTLLLELLIQYA